MSSAVSVCLSLCQFVRMITSERLNVGLWNLAIRCMVQKSHPSSNLGVKGQGHQGQKNEKLLSHPHWQYIVRHALLRRTLHAAADYIPLRRSRGWQGNGSTRWRRFAGAVLGALRPPPVLCRWENQHMLTSLSVCQYVCPHDNFRTTKHRTNKLGG